MGGEEAFEVEHFRPKSKFPELDCVYTNLYYACRGCNGHKSETWPTADHIARGMRFADPCESDPYVHHLIEDPNGSVSGTTPCGAYTAAHLRLHRDDLKRWRRLRKQALTDLPTLTRLTGDLEQLRSVTADSEAEEVEARIAGLKHYVEQIKRQYAIG